MALDEMVDLAVDTLQEHAHICNPSDERVIVISVQDTIRIRTGEQDTAT